MKRGFLIGTGVVLLIGGLGLMASGGLVAGLLGSSESISTTPTRLRGTGVALVADDVSIDYGTMPVPASLGRLTLTVSSPDSRAMFVGAATPSDVDAYLIGAPYDVVLDLTAGHNIRTRPVPGTQQPPVPASQQLWTAAASGAPATLSASLGSGNTLVVMNADASPVITADVVVTLAVPGSWRASWIAVGIGALAIVLAVLAFWRAKVAGRRRSARAAASALAVVPVEAQQSTVALPDSAAEDFVDTEEPIPADDDADATVEGEPVEVEVEVEAEAEDEAEDDAGEGSATAEDETEMDADPLYTELATTFGLPAHTPDETGQAATSTDAPPSQG